jgi:hypothetical protein
MKLAVAVLSLAALAGCASYGGGSLQPGRSTAAEVESVMGPAADKRVTPNGETVLWYPRMPYGDGSYAARIGADGRLIAIEQRITEENIAKIERGKTTAAEVRDIVGPPYRVDQYPRMDREIWTYKLQVFPFPKALFVQLSPDRVVREVYYMDDPEIPRLGSGHRTGFRR